jgi:glutamyl-tRNA reductase
MCFNFNYDVDDLKGLVDANLKERQMAAEAISNEIPAEIKIMCFNFSRNFIRNSFSRHLSFF